MALHQMSINNPIGDGDSFLFNVVPNPVWLEDWTPVEDFCNSKRAAGVTDIDAILAADHALMRRVASSVIVKAVNQRAVEFVKAPEPGILLGNLPGELFTEGSLQSLRKQVVAVWEGRAAEEHEVQGADFGADVLDAQLQWAAPLVDGQPDYANVLVMFWDLKRHKETERSMQDQVAVLESLLEMSRGIAATFETDVILRLLADTSVRLTAAASVMLVLFDTDAEVIEATVEAGTPPVSTPPMSFDMIKNGLIGRCVATRSSVTLPDLGEAMAESAMPDEVRNGLRGHPLIVAPIIDDDSVIGVVLILGGRGREFAPTHESIARMVATQATVALRKAKLYQEVRASRDSLHEAHEALKQTQTQLLSAQKLEAIGGMAAGIAHEINTPIQFVSDNTSFVRTSIETLTEFTSAHVEFLEKLVDHPELGEEVAPLLSAWKQKDCDFLLEEIPDAIAETLEGAARVSEIVRAMKEFAHPGSESKTSVDVNRVVETTKAVSRNEWKYVADFELDLAEELPIINALPGPLGQSLLIMIVNAAQAIAEHRDIDADGKGTIGISTLACGVDVEIRVADNGPGIPPDIADRIFDPFFTTKDVGEGSGQGLSIAHSVVVDKHHGRIWVEDADPGAVFVVRLPISGKPSVGADQQESIRQMAVSTPVG